MDLLRMCLSTLVSMCEGGLAVGFLLLSEDIQEWVLNLIILEGQYLITFSHYEYITI